MAVGSGELVAVPGEMLLSPTAQCWCWPVPKCCCADTFASRKAVYVEQCSFTTVQVWVVGDAAVVQAVKRLCRFTRDPVESWGAEGGVHVAALGPAAGQGRFGPGRLLLCPDPH